MTLTEILNKNKAYFQKMVFEMNDENALKFRQVFPVWTSGAEYVEGQRVRFNEELWRVKKNLTASLEPVEGEDYEKVIVVLS